MIVKVLSGGNTRELECEKGENLLALLQRHGYHITARCGGRGSCGKCKVKVLQGAFENQREDFVLSCLATVGNDCAVEVFETEGGGLTYARAALSAADGEEGFGVALDIGTTTMAFSLVDLKTGAEIETSGVLNSQGAYGADVISRIVSANEGNAAALQRCVLDQTRDMLHTFMQKYSLPTLKRLAVCGNTTMLHLFLQKSVKGIGQYPFTAEFLDIVRLSGAELSLPVEEIVLLPSVAAYLGADIVAGGLAANLSAGNDLLVDIGTNGELSAMYDYHRGFSTIDLASSSVDLAFQVDLGAVTTLTAVRMYGVQNLSFDASVWNNAEYGYLLPKSFTVYTSEDGETWTQRKIRALSSEGGYVRGGVDKIIDFKPTTARATNDFVFADIEVNARYVRIVVDGANAVAGTSGVWRVEIGELQVISSFDTNVDYVYPETGRKGD